MGKSVKPSGSSNRSTTSSSSRSKPKAISNNNIKRNNSKELKQKQQAKQQAKHQLQQTMNVQIKRKYGRNQQLVIYCAVIGVLMICVNLHIERRIWTSQDMRPKYSAANPDPNYDPQKYDRLTNTYRRSIFSDDLMQFNLGNTTTTPPYSKTSSVAMKRTTPSLKSQLGKIKLAPEHSVCTFGTDILVVIMSPARDHRERQNARLGWITNLRARFHYASHLFVTSSVVDVSVARSLKNEALQKGDLLVSAHNDAKQKPPFVASLYLTLGRYISMHCPRISHVVVIHSQYELNLPTFKEFIDKEGGEDGNALQAGTKKVTCSSVHSGVDIPYCSEVCFVMSGTLALESYAQMESTYLQDKETERIVDPLEYVTGYIRNNAEAPVPEKFNLVEPVCNYLPKFQFKLH